MISEFHLTDLDRWGLKEEVKDSDFLWHNGNEIFYNGELVGKFDFNGDIILKENVVI